MAHFVPSEIQSLRSLEQSRLNAIRRKFKNQGKTFQVPDEHWSGVLPEKAWQSLPGKKENQ